MSKAKIGITLDSKALKTVDAIADTKGAARSTIIEIAVKQFLDRYERQQQRIIKEGAST